MLSAVNPLDHMRRIVPTLLTSLFVATLTCVETLGQQPQKYPPYTLETRYTEYDHKGEIFRASSYTRYQSSTGEWRVVHKFAGEEVATIYRRGSGVYKSSSRTMRMLRDMDHAPGCPIRTREELRADPKFTRTEEILGFTAYVLSDRTTDDILRNDHYFIPELGGGTPVKQVMSFKYGAKVVIEPIRVKLGEPAPADITGPDYLVVQQAPTFVQNIDAHILSKPDAIYPSEALNLGIAGTASVLIAVDETGAVIVADSLTGVPQSLREAAVEAAYKASFKPIKVDGKAVVATGIIRYQFVLPK